MDAWEEGLPGKPCFSAQQPRLCRRLSPFFLTCAIYFLLWIPQDRPSWVSALVKCLPVVCLAASLQVERGGRRYRTLLQGALLCSAVGDACLIWPDAFLHGVAAFAAAHLLYLWAFGLTPLRPGLLLPIALVSVPYSGILLLHLPTGMALALAAYSLVLASVLWRGLARGGSIRWGVLLFTFSDMVLAWDTFAQPLPHGRLLVMTTYYAAQFLITLSGFQSPRLKTN
ncbi:PREDICTED: lysoplasmalogenase isoform X1 [Odobenus rosmarus divergens]|uniref:Lysoplasmalogenase TMEM86B n=1 Tax=Odobenus rosmarus divergens TaxID=9708 RepID=A0A2U3W9T8_ODORO|nr:PREDICTED: lysoplasmalogenase isoform X1 [Odobenus rosmarus divergens]